jgi:hypothetical protein
MLVKVVDASEHAVLEVFLGSDTDVAKNRAGEFGEEALDEVEPGAVFWRDGLTLWFRFDQHVVSEGAEGGADAEQGAEGGVSGAAAVEAEDELIEGGLEMLLARAFSSLIRRWKSMSERGKSVTVGTPIAVLFICSVSHHRPRHHIS